MGGGAGAAGAAGAGESPPLGMPGIPGVAKNGCLKAFREKCGDGSFQINMKTLLSKTMKNPNQITDTWGFRTRLGGYVTDRNDDFFGK